MIVAYLNSCLLSRIEGNQFEDRSGNKMWLVTHLEVTRQIVVDDLRVVKVRILYSKTEFYLLMIDF